VASKKEAVAPAETEKNRGGRVAYETPKKHHTVLERSGKRLRNAREAVAAADEALYAKVLAALLDGVKPSAITRSTGENHTSIQRMVKRAKEEGHSF
jgi:hypothetical protein